MAHVFMYPFDVRRFVVHVADDLNHDQDGVDCQQYRTNLNTYKMNNDSINISSNAIFY